MSTLTIEELRVAASGKEILRGIDIEVSGGEVHAVMGPNGSGKSTLSHVIMGRPGYEVLGGSIRLDGDDILGLAPWERAAAGLFLAMQYPTEVPGVSVLDVLEAAVEARGGDRTQVADRMAVEAERIGFEEAVMARSLNVDLSGGEKKRAETLQLAVLEPKIAVLDEIDSGLDVDALQAVSRRVQAATEEIGMGVLAITHYSRLLEELDPDRVHILSGGLIQASGGPELAAQVEASGYSQWAEAPVETAVSIGGLGGDPFADPFADPLA